MQIVHAGPHAEMPSSSQPVLLLDESRLQHFDPTNQKDLFMMWSEAIEHGKRLENMSWRLWNREALCRSAPAATASGHLPISRSSSVTTSTHRASDAAARSTELPKLSSSVESACSLASSAANSSSDEQHDASAKQPGCNNRSVNLGSLVHSMKKQPCLPAAKLNVRPADEQRETKSQACAIPTGTTTAAIATPAPTTNATTTNATTTTTPATAAQPPRHATTHTVAGDSSTSTVATVSDSFVSTAGTSHTSTDSAMCGSEHSVVRGFTPGRLSSYTSKSQLAPAPTPILKSSSRAAQTKKKAGMFMLGGSSGDYESSLRDRMSPSGSGPDGQSHDSQRASSKKQTSFDDHVTEICTKQPAAHVHNDVFEDSDEETSEDDDEDDEEVSESAIDEDDDDDDAWEDDEEETPDRPKQISFQRIDSAANFKGLPSRKSQIALDIERVRSTGNLQNVHPPSALRRSRTATPNGPSMPASPSTETSLELRAQAACNSTAAQPIAAAAAASALPDISNPALSPRTTRRNMLAGELTESFRKQMIWERRQRNVYTTQAPLKRAHTSADVRRVDDARQCGSDAPNGSWNQFFNGGSGEYHSKGW